MPSTSRRSKGQAGSNVSSRRSFYSTSSAPNTGSSQIVILPSTSKQSGGPHMIASSHSSFYSGSSAPRSSSHIGILPSTSRQSGRSWSNRSFHSDSSATIVSKNDPSASLMTNMNVASGAQSPVHLTDSPVKLISTTGPFRTRLQPSRASKGLHIMRFSFAKNEKSPRTIVRRYSATRSHGLTRVSVVKHTKSPKRRARKYSVIGNTIRTRRMPTRAQTKIITSCVAVASTGMVAPRRRKLPIKRSPRARYYIVGSHIIDSRTMARVLRRASVIAQRRTKSGLGNKKKRSGAKSKMTKGAKQHKSFSLPQTRVRSYNACLGLLLGPPRRMRVQRMTSRAQPRIIKRQYTAKNRARPRARRYSYVMVTTPITRVYSREGVIRRRRAKQRSGNKTRRSGAKSMRAKRITKLKASQVRGSNASGRMIGTYRIISRRPAKPRARVRKTSAGTQGIIRVQSQASVTSSQQLRPTLVNNQMISGTQSGTASAETSMSSNAFRKMRAINQV